MENLARKIALLALFVLTSCQSINYEADFGFLNSAQANSMEYFTLVNGSPCKDMDGKIGLCAKRIKSDQALQFKMDAKEYSYRFNLTCTSSLNADFSIDVEKGKVYEFSIPSDKFSNVRSFTCIGEIFPHDRDQEVSANWSVRVIVVDSEYLERELVYKTTRKGKEFLVFGKHARYVTVNGKRYEKKPMVEYKGGPGYSESERMRFNYWGL